MSIELVIVSRQEAEWLLQERSFSHLISIYGSREHPLIGFEEFSGIKLGLCFDDIDFEHFRNCIGPSEEDIKTLIDFAEALRYIESSLLIHCTAGISRSTAAGFIILQVLYGDCQLAIQKVKEIRPIAWPNLRMLQLADHLLAQEGKMVACRNIDLDLSDKLF